MSTRTTSPCAVAAMANCSVPGGKPLTMTIRAPTAPNSASTAAPALPKSGTSSTGSPWAWVAALIPSQPGWQMATVGNGSTGGMPQA